MTALPPVHSTIFATFPNRSALSAYELVLEAERVAKEDLDRMNARVVGFLMINFCESRQWLEDLPLSQVTKAVLSCNTGNANVLICLLGGQYREQLLRAFRSSKGPVPQPSNHVSRPSFDTLQDMVNDCLEESPTNYRAAKKTAMARDGFRCMITGAYDPNSMVKAPDLRARMMKEHNSTQAPVQCCHILSESTTQNINPDDPTQKKRREYASSVFAVLRTFGLQAIIDKLSVAGGIHNVFNVLSLRTELHDHFDNLRLWFEPTSEENTYMVCSSEHNILRSFLNSKTRVHFEVSPEAAKYLNKSGKPVNIPLPSRQLLVIHAVCAKVAHMSGAAEYFARFDNDVEEFDFQLKDNNSAHILHQLLNNVALIKSRIGGGDSYSLDDSPRSGVVAETHSHT